NVIPPIAIRVREQLLMNATSVLELRLEEDDWDSTISFDAGIPVALGGTLRLQFAAGVDPQSQAGRTFRIFAWTGVAPIRSLAVPDSQLWDLSGLYTTGVARYVGISFAPGDFDEDGDVDHDDLVQWRGDFGANGDSDADEDGDSDGADFLIWQRQIGSPP